MVLEGGEGAVSCPGRSLLSEKTGTHCTGGWVGPRAPPGFYSRNVQPEASRYTDRATGPTNPKYSIHILASVTDAV